MTPCSAAAPSPFSATAMARTKLAPAAFHSAATVSSCVIRPFRCSDAEWFERKALIPNVDPQLMHDALYFSEHFLGFIPAVPLDRFTCRAHQSKCTLSILKHLFGCLDLAGVVAVQHCSLHPKAMA